MSSGPSGSDSPRWTKALLLTICLLFSLLALLFHDCFFPGYALFSNDGPLGALVAECRRVPAGFLGGWEDLNTLGYREGGALPDITYALLWILGPVGFSKFYAAIALLIFGVAAWVFFRRMGLVLPACVLGAVAAALNSSFFSAACWGVAAHPLTIALDFLALAALADPSPRRRWLRVPLAGLAVGMGVVEGADIGAIFSLYVSAFVIYQAWFSGEQKTKSLLGGLGRLSVVACFAVLIAAQSLSVLITTQIQGVAGTQQDRETKEQHWDFATQWSLPKREALGFAVPGLFGYRMDTSGGGEYWGAVGRDPNWDRYFANGKQGAPPQSTIRFSGGGVYAGILVLLGGIWAVVQSFRKKDSAFSITTRYWIWFWFGVFIVSLLLAFGRFAPFYQFLYALPYFSTIRNPAKFTYPCSWALVVLFAYGIHGMWHVYMSRPAKTSSHPPMGSAWQRLPIFERRWTIGCWVAFACAVLTWLIFSSSADTFERYLQEVQFEPAEAHSIAQFASGQIGLFLVVFAAALVLYTLIVTGRFRGNRYGLGVILLGLLLVVDMARANEPWIITWNYAEKYATNPIIDFLRQKPYEHRVAGLPRWVLVPQILQSFHVPPEVPGAEQYFRRLYGIEWTQHHFLYYNIQSLDVIQMPRMPEDLQAYETKFFPQSSGELPLVARHWQLTNTRYLLGAAGFLAPLNRYFDPIQHRFQIAERFNIVPKPGIAQPSKLEELTAVMDTNGPFAVFEFTGALPRVGLYSSWQVTTNDQATLDELAKPDFNPEKSVLVAAGVPPEGSTTNLAAGEVKFVSYEPKHIVLRADATSPAVLLLNDRYDSNWKVSVDDRPETLLRCNYLMRGVFLPKGSHKVEFRFVQRMDAFYLSLGGVVFAVLLMVLLLVSRSEPRLSNSASIPPAAPNREGDQQKRSGAK